MGLEINCLSNQNSMVSVWLLELRDITIQNDPMRFRRNLERIAEIAGYEVSKGLEFESKTIQTPLAEFTGKSLVKSPVIASIFRAGLPMHQGLLNVFDRAENAFISAYRKHISQNDFEIKVEYSASPSLENKVLIISDPMLASGQSMLLCYQALCEQYGTPKMVHFVSAIASEEGVQYLSENFTGTGALWVGDIDNELTAHSYIVPGLGDAGDLAFGEKS